MCERTPMLSPTMSPKRAPAATDPLFAAATILFTRDPVGIHEHDEVGHFARASRSCFTLSATLRPVVSITMYLRS
jgi:hypothetical protein